ncbi:MAG: hypothetical protein GX574_10905 [Lentisphaerae bacterium]|nr:hypothetical protein [Lentisphaerota bacterium]HQL88017.1 hypothetical protein [Lentisphaeria bacterium]
MAAPESKQAKTSETLFDQEITSASGIQEISSADDIKRSVAVVEAFWALEKARRRRLALKYGLPAVVLVTALALLAAWLFKVFPFAEKPVWLTAPEVPPEGDPTALVERNEGNPEAKIKIVVTHPEGKRLDEKVTRILNEVIDLKPSEFHIAYHITDKLPMEERKVLVDYEGQSISVNGRTSFTFGDPKRPDRTIDLMGFSPVFFAPQDLLEVVNSVYQEVYGPTEKPLLDMETLDLAPPMETGAATEREPLPKIVIEGGEQGDIMLRLPEIKVEE